MEPVLFGLQFVFVVAYMTGTINWPLYWVFSPAIFFLLLIVAFALWLYVGIPIYVKAEMALKRRNRNRSN